MPSYIDTVLEENQIFDSIPSERVLKLVEKGGVAHFSENGINYIVTTPNKVQEEIDEAIKSSLEHFAQMVEKEVIGEDESPVERTQLGLTLTVSALSEATKAVRVHNRNQLRAVQRAKLKSLLTPTTKEE